MADFDHSITRNAECCEVCRSVSGGVGISLWCSLHDIETMGTWVCDDFYDKNVIGKRFKSNRIEAPHDQR